MDQSDFTVHDINVAENTFFTPSGQVAKQKKLTFYVGTHGPFTRAYKPEDATADRMKSDIAAEVALLQSVHNLGV